MPALRFARVSSPLGELLCVHSVHGIARIAFPEENDGSALDEMADAFGSRPFEDAVALQPLRGELDAYFEGTLRVFRSLPDLGAARGFLRRALEAAAMVPFGAVATYGELAARAGSPRAARAAGTAMRRNPVPLLVPCHRIVPADGSLGGYSGHEDRKAFLLDLEESAIRAGRRLAAPAR